MTLSTKEDTRPFAMPGLLRFLFCLSEHGALSKTVFPPDEHPFSPCEGRTPKKMEWRLSPELQKAVYFAETRLSDLIRQHDVQTLEYST